MSSRRGPARPTRSPVAMRSVVAAPRVGIGVRLRAAGADLRAAQILQDRDLRVPRPPRPRGRGANVGAWRLVRAVREVQTEDVDAGGDERVEHRVVVAGRSDRGDDLRVPHVESDLNYGADRSGTPSNAISPRSTGRATRCSRTSPARATSTDLPLVDAEVGALLRVLATAARRDAHPRDRHRDRLLRHLARGRAAGGRHAVHDGVRRGSRARGPREFARAGLADRVTVIIGDAQRLLAKVAGPVRPDLSGRRQEAVRADARSARGSAPAGRTARDRQRAVERRGRAGFRPHAPSQRRRHAGDRRLQRAPERRTRRC